MKFKLKTGYFDELISECGHTLSFKNISEGIDLENGERIIITKTSREVRAQGANDLFVEIGIFSASGDIKLNEDKFKLSYIIDVEVD